MKNWQIGNKLGVAVCVMDENGDVWLPAYGFGEAPDEELSKILNCSAGFKFYARLSDKYNVVCVLFENKEGVHSATYISRENIEKNHPDIFAELTRQIARVNGGETVFCDDNLNYVKDNN
ncbi:MAG: hypothetical protein FWE86_05440, partial [Oscillospiraceae bacterium]|nr:hypothetical protein [Oscillospiraceae bacterium]